MSVFRSLRFRITSLAMVVVIAALAVGGMVILQSVRNHLLGQVDQGLVNTATYYEARILHHQFIPQTTPGGQMGQFFLANGTLIASSANLKGLPPLIHVHPGAVHPVLMSIQYPPFGNLRVLEQQLTPVNGPILVEAQQINEIVDASNSLTELLAIVLPLLAFTLAILIWAVVGRAMKRVEAIRVAVADVSDRNLEERVPSSRSGDELDRLVQTMNDMLARLESSLRRERQFIADASHELRSPIAALRAALEADRRDPDELRRSHDAALSALQRLDLLVEGLLTLDSVNGAARGPAAAPVDLDELVLLQVDYLRRGTGLELDVSGVSAGQVVAREVDMMRILENLSSNAIRHAESRIEYSVSETDHHVRFSVADDGPGVPEAMRTHIFERLARIEPDRDPSKGGSGLGLSIVAEIVRAYGGQVWVEGVQPHGARFVVQLPASTAMVQHSPSA